MRGGRLQRFQLLLPFSIRCDSESSVALAVSSITPKQSNTVEEGGEENSKMNKNQSLWKVSFTQGLHRLTRRFKSFSQFFVYKEEMHELVEKEMEIGFPTDVEHVTHIGSDGVTTVNNTVPNWELLSFPSISLPQFELAMSAQSHAHLGIN